MPEQVEQERQETHPKRFTSYEEFLREFYPKAAEEQKHQKETENDAEYGVELALSSLNRHADTLRFDGGN